MRRVSWLVNPYVVAVYLLLATLAQWSAHIGAAYGAERDGGAQAITYVGRMPCADCEAIEVTLTLFPDLTYRMRRIYIGTRDEAGQPFYELGRWARAQDDGGRLRLQSGAESTTLYRVVAADRLRLLDSGGNEIASQLNYELVRAPGIDEVSGPMPLSGLYAYQADAGTFNECFTGQRYPVAPEAANAELERAYLAARSIPGEFIRVQITGRFESRTAEAGAGSWTFIIVDSVQRLGPGQTCAREAAAVAALLNTYWRPVEIDGEPLSLQAGEREPHFVIAMDGGSVRGYSGCNRLSGRFEQRGDGLRFGPLATTRMACLPAASELEARFLGALDAASSGRIVGDTLELRDAGGKLRMRCEARYMQ